MELSEALILTFIFVNSFLIFKFLWQKNKELDETATFIYERTWNFDFVSNQIEFLNNDLEKHKIYIISLQKECEKLVRENAILANRIDVLEKEKGD